MKYHNNYNPSPSIKERSITKLMYEYELLTSICAGFLYISEYAQLGAEIGKIILKKNLKNLESTQLCKT